MSLIPVIHDDHRHAWLDLFFESLYGYSELEGSVLYAVDTGQLLDDETAETFELATYGAAIRLDDEEHHILIAYLVPKGDDEGLAAGVSITPLASDAHWFLGKLGDDIKVREPLPTELIDHVIRAANQAEQGEPLADGDAPEL